MSCDIEGGEILRYQPKTYELTYNSFGIRPHFILVRKSEVSFIFTERYVLFQGSEYDRR
jgi:hypothetical protein